MIRILFLLDKLVPAGTQNNLLEIVKGLDREKFQPFVISLSEGGELVQEFKAAGVDPIVLNVGRVYGLAGIGAYFFLKDWMRRNKIDIVQTFFLKADIIGTLAAKKAGVKRIITSRRDEGFWRTDSQLRINCRLNRSVDVILANSKAVARAVSRDEKFPLEKIRVISNGVRIPEFSAELRKSMRKELGFNDEDVLIGVVANLRHEVKGHSYLFEAMPEVLKRIPKAKLLLIGDGPLRSQFEKQVSGLGIASSVFFLGSRRDIPALLNAIDIGCLPSETEGFSNAVLEYMAYSKPVVACEVGGNPEMVTSETGFLVPARDSAALAARLIELAQDPVLRSRMGAAGRARVKEEFSFEKMVRAYEHFFAEIAGRYRICFLIWSLDLGGAEQVVMNIARKLDQRRFEPIVCCLNEEGRYAAEIEKEGVRVVALHKKPKVDLSFLKRLIRFLKEEKIDLLHTHLFTSHLWGRIAAKAAGVRVISTEHNMDTWKSPWHFALDRMLLRVNERIIFVSENAKRFYQDRIGNLNGKSRVFYNGIDTGRFMPEKNRVEELRKLIGIPAHAQVLGIVGRLVTQKGHGDFLEALNIIRKKHRDAVGMIVGDGELRAELERKVHALNLDGHVYFLGFRSDLEKLYPVMDVLVLSSYREGFPMTILEAMAAETPVVATDVGGVRECLVNAEDGMLVPANQPQLLADAISELLYNKSLRNQIVQNASIKVRKSFSIQNMVLQHEALYTEVLAS